MTFQRMLVQTVTITHVGPGAPGRYNLPEPTVTTSQAAAFVEPLSAEEDTVLRDTGVQSFRGFFMPDIPIAMADRITVDGKTYECIGEPAMFLNPRTNLKHHQEVALKEVT